MLTRSVLARWLRIHEAAEYVGCTLYFMRELIRNRRIQPTKIGKVFIIDVHDIDAYIEGLKKEQITP
jgi:excisionase family DNA binding protein